MPPLFRLLPPIAFLLLLALPAAIAKSPKKNASQYLSEPAAWFLSPEGRRITDNILSYQSELGGWPKNKSTTESPYTGDPSDLHGTFDNGATTDELRFLAKAWQATGEDRVKKAFLKGLDLILKAQYPTGGWPQFYPPDRQYHRHITFNDNAMIRLMIFLREVAKDPVYGFVAPATKEECSAAFNRGVECILKCQVRINGVPTVWCAQHDEVDYTPRPARKFELASLSGSESVGIVRLLMSLDSPSPEVVTSVNAATEWFRKSEIRGIRIEKKTVTGAAKEHDLVVVEDPSAPPIWARFYDLNTGKPFFCDRDGIPKGTLAEIGFERRNGYRWYGDWPRKLLDEEYPSWKQRLSVHPMSKP